MKTENLTSSFLEKSCSILQEFYLEFFGIFLPGVVVVGLILVMIVVSGSFMLAETEESKFLGDIWWCLQNNSLLATMFFLFVAYMIGAIVYRREPKKPDLVSSYRQWKKSTEIERERLAVQYEKGMDKSSSIREFVEMSCRTLHWLQKRERGKDKDFPYPCLRKFLMARHLGHLAAYVSWCKGYKGPVLCDDETSVDASTVGGRHGCSKHIVNTIKHCVLASGHQNLIADMRRNECHIRMMCSFWYVLRFVMRFAIVSFLVSIAVAWSLSQTALAFWMSSSHWIFAMSYLLGIFFVYYCLLNIERGLHYVRTREVVMILQSACILENCGDERFAKMLGSAKSDASRFARDYCLKCGDKMCEYALSLMKSERHDETP